MIFILYGCWLGAASLFVLELAGRFGAPAERVPRWRSVGVIGAAGAGLIPILLWLRDPSGVGWPYPLVAATYVAAFVVFAAGVIDWQDRRPASLWLRRVGFLGLLAVAALPSMVLLLLTPLVLLAGSGLVRARATPERSAAEQ